MTATSLGATLANCSDPTVLVPGSAGALRGDADQLDQQSRALAEQAADLRDAHPTTWAGDAADGWAGRREQLAQTLEAVSEVHSTAGAALLLHAQTLEWGQDAASTAIRLYQRGCAVRDAELGPSSVLTAGRGSAATDSGAAMRNLAERTLSAAQNEVSASARAAATVLDELSVGLPDGRWHLGEFAQGMWSWVTGITDMLTKFNSLRLLVDTDGLLRDGAEMWQGGVDTYESLTEDPIGTSEQLAQLDLLRDRPAQWWGQLAPDIALTVAGGAIAGARALRGFSLRLSVPERSYRPTVPGFHPDGSIDAAAFATDPDTAYFWSGRTQNVGGESVALEHARAGGGTTLEELMRQRGIELPEWDPDNPDVVSVWSVASAAYAEQANGVVRAVIGQDLRPGNVWESAELPVLRSSPDVTQVVRIDPLTGEEVVIYP
jgi:uncharacterized protein YukE